jgi:gas vesicle protein GvpL/GvpF
MSDTATYVYCLAHAAASPKTTRVPSGLPGATRPSIVPVARSLWLAVAEVPLDTYGPGPLETALRDMPWVTDVAVAHEAVVEHFARQARVTVIPMKLFTMFSSLPRAIDESRSHRRDVRAIMRRIAGCEEWGVRMTRKSGVAPARRAATAKPSSGAAFLAAKKEARDLAREAVLTAVAAADRAFTTLAAIARDARRRDDAPEGAAAPPVLDAAFLVPANRRVRFKSAARRLAADSAKAGAEITLSGPWPAYNFVEAGSPS